MMPARSFLMVAGACIVMSFGTIAPPWQARVAAAAPIVAQDTGDGGGLSTPNPLAGLGSMLSPDKLGKLIQDTAAFLLKQLVSGLRDKN